MCESVAIEIDGAFEIAALLFEARLGQQEIRVEVPLQGFIQVVDRMSVVLQSPIDTGAELVGF